MWTDNTGFKNGQQYDHVKMGNSMNSIRSGSFFPGKKDFHQMQVTEK